MTPSAPVEASPTLAAAPEPTTRSVAATSCETSDAFSKVLTEQTAKVLGDPKSVARDGTPKSAKRIRLMVEATPGAAANVPVLASVVGVHSSAATTRVTIDADSKQANEPSGVPSPAHELTDVPGSSSHVLDSSERTSATPDGVELTFTSVDPKDVPAASVAGLMNKQLATASTPASTTTTTPTPTPPSMRIAAETNPQNPIASEGTSLAVPITSAEPARSLDVTDATLDAAVTPTISSASAPRVPMSPLAKPTPSRVDAPRTELSTTSLSNSATAPARHVMSESASPPRALNEFVAASGAGNSRSVGSTTPSATSSNEAQAPQLDVTDFASSISQAVIGPDGSYTLNIAMHPGDLGHVQAVVSLNGGELHVAISPQTLTGHTALANAVDGLKSELSRGGLNVNISLRDPSSHSDRRHPDAPRTAASVSDGPPADDEPSTASESLSVSKIHLIL